MHRHHKEFNFLYDDSKLDEKDIGLLDTLKRDISDDYAKGKISEQHYSNLNKEISILYEEIYNKRIDSLNSKYGSSSSVSNEILLDNIKNDIKDAYAKGKISEQHYDLLNEKISDYKNNQKSINKLSSFQNTTTSTAEGSPIKFNNLQCL